MENLFSLHGKAGRAHMSAIIKSSRFMYGSQCRDDRLIRDLSTLPRYGHLVRMALVHYGGTHYNPLTIPDYIEINLRQFIKTVIEYKVIFKTGGYDWEWLDSYFKKYIGEALGVALPYDVHLLKDETRWKFQAKFLNDPDRPV